MPPPGATASPPVAASSCSAGAWPRSLLGVLFLLGPSIAAGRQTPERPAPPGYLDEVLARPASDETWPLWREAYLRNSFDYDQDSEKESQFHDRLRAYFRERYSRAGGSMPKEWETDPVAWLVLGSSYMHPEDDAMDTPGDDRLIALAEAASRKAIALGDPAGAGNSQLAMVLLVRAMFHAQNPSAGGPPEGELREAEDCLRRVERVNPGADVSLHRARIARLRNDRKRATELLDEAVRRHPNSASLAMDYLTDLLTSGEVSGKLADRTGPFIVRFPKAAGIHALHAIALLRDGRGGDAAAALDQARSLDPRVDRLIGGQAVKAIAESRALTTAVLDAVQALKAGRHQAAAIGFREALEKDPSNPLLAQGLARSLAEGAIRRGRASAEALVSSDVSEIRRLAERFPREASIQASLAATLHAGGRSIEAAEALDRVKALGGSAERFIGPHGLQEIRRAADSDRSLRFWIRLALGVVATAVLWIAVMFALGLLLAVSIPRVPRSFAVGALERSRREVWLERLYLLFLTLGLVGFYLTVPVVAAGVLACTLILFGLLLAVRVVHFGVLQRGLWAFWYVLRCALMGPGEDGPGIEVTSADHPRLFQSLGIVADQVRTRPVDRVFLTPTARIGVRQEGAGPFGLLGKRQRVLQLGISSLPLLNVKELHSILAHEYGHFSRNDTFYGRFIFQVSASLATSLAVMSAAGGILNYINPFYGFWWCYLRAYTLLSTGFSRSREFLADRQAVAAYGKQSFVSGLTKVAVDGVLLESTVFRGVQQLLQEGKAFANAFEAYRHLSERPEHAESRERMLETMRRERPGWFDTHPTYTERLTAVAGFPDGEAGGGDEPAVNLLDDPEAVEAKLTELLTHHIYGCSAA